MKKGLVAQSKNKPTTKLQALRISYGVSQDRMARYLGMNLRQYITLEKSKAIHKREPEVLEKICKTFNCTKEDLIDDPEVLAAIKAEKFKKEHMV